MVEMLEEAPLLVVENPALDAGWLDSVPVRNARIQVASPEAFVDSFVCEQALMVDERSEPAPPLTNKALFGLFADVLCNTEMPESQRAVFVLGLVDALLRDRKTYPAGFWPL